MSAISTISQVPSPPPELSLYRFTQEQLRQLTAADLLPHNGNGGPLRFTVEQYQRMIRLGIFAEDERAELLDGWIVNKMSRNPPHDAALLRTQMTLFRRLPTTWLCRGQSGMTTQTSQPEPDLAVAVGPLERYDDHHPGIGELVLVIEIADSTLHSDRNFKGPLYARAGIPVYWIINLIDDQIEVYTQPTPEGAYDRRQDFPRDTSVPLVLAGQEIDRLTVNDLLPSVGHG